MMTINKLNPIRSFFIELFDWALFHKDTEHT